MIKSELIRYPGVGKRADSNTYQFALRVPKDVQPHYSGPWAVRCSLGTAHLREANDKAKALHAEWAARFEVLRSGKPAPVDHAALRARLLDTAVTKFLPGLDRRSAASLREEVLRGIAGGSVPEHEAESYVADVLKHAQCPAAETEALAHYAMLLELEHEALTNLSRTFPLRVKRIAERRALLALHAPAPADSPSAAAPKSQPAQGGHRIADALVEWKGTQTKPKTIGTFTRHAEQFAELMGDPELATLDKAQAIQYRDRLQAWAVANGKTARTADDALGNVRALVNVARDRGWISGNPLERLGVKVGGKESEGREPWTGDELGTLFADPIWLEYRLPSVQSCQPSPSSMRTAGWWSWTSPRCRTSRQPRTSQSP